jgi:hypothetical protein
MITLIDATKHRQLRLKLIALDSKIKQKRTADFLDSFSESSRYRSAKFGKAARFLPGGYFKN